MKTNRFIYYVLFAIAFVVASCQNDDPNALRKEFIEVYATADCVEPLERTHLPVRGGEVTLYIKSNIQFDLEWQDGNIDELGQIKPWARVSPLQSIGDGLWKITVSADKLSEEAVYEKRSGVLMLKAPEIHAGRFFVVDQGLTARVASDFSWLTGSEKPNETISDVIYENWSNLQKNKGFKTTIIPGQEKAWVYGKAGYIKLGNSDGMGADLIAPREAMMRYDSLLVVSFKAVVQNGPSTGDFYGDTEGVYGDGEQPADPTPEPEPDPDPTPDDPTPSDPTNPGEGGTELIKPMSVAIAPAADEMDNNTLTLEVVGGGVIRDFITTGATSITFNDIPTYNRMHPDFPANMFDGGEYLVFIESTKANPITANTTVRFIAGSMSDTPAAKNSRIFLDDIYIYRVNAKFDEDFYQLNGGKSGKDQVLGGASNN
jgi:hypothetical protein